MFGIVALTVAVPYCDLVGTDDTQAHALTVTGLAARIGMTIMRARNGVKPGVQHATAT